MTDKQLAMVASRCINRAMATRGRLAVLRMADDTCRVMLVADAELLIRTGRATWRNVAGVYDEWSSAEDIVADILAVRP